VHLRTHVCVSVELKRDYCVSCAAPCLADPRAPPSTDVLLSLRLLGDGVAMGLRGDDRITSEGLTLSVEDVSEVGLYKCVVLLQTFSTTRCSMETE
jgi:hypothetical protein